MKFNLFLLFLIITNLVNAQTIFKPTSLMIGKGTDVDMSYIVDRDGADNPMLRWDADTFKWYFSNDGTTFEEFVGKAYVDSAVSGATIPDADATTKGKIQLAGDLSGTADSPTVPGLALKAPLESPDFTGTPTAPTPTALDNSTKIATTAFVDGAITGKQDTLTDSAGLAAALSDETGSGLAVFGTSPHITTPTGIVKNDVGLGNVDNTSDANKPVSTATQTALDGKVSGPASASDNAVPRYDSTTGKLIQNSGVTISDSDDVTGVNSLLSAGSITSQDGNIEGENLVEEGSDDSGSSGSEVLISGKGIIRLTNASLVSVAAIDDTTSGMSKTIINNTGNPIQIVNDGGSTSDAYKILTGTGANIALADSSSLLLKYNSSMARWIVVGGTGSGGGGSNSILSNTDFELGATDWTTTGVTPTSEAAELPGEKMLCFNASASPWTLSQDSTIGAAGFVNGVNGKASIRIKSSHNADITVCPRKAGAATTDCITLETLQRNGQWGLYAIPFVLGGTSNGLDISAASGTGLTCVDDANVEMAKEFDSVQAVSGDKTFSPTGSFTTNTTYTGSYYQVGSRAIISYKLAFAGAPNSTSLTLNLPAGLTIDLSKLLDGTSAKGLGRGSLRNSAGEVFDISARYWSSTSVQVYPFNANATYTVFQNVVTQALPITIAAGDTIEFTMTVPIVGWDSTVNTLTTEGPKDVLTQMSSNATQSLSTATYTKINLQVIDKDKTSSGSIANNRINVPTDGTYLITATLGYAGNPTGSRYALIYKNGTLIGPVNRGRLITAPNSSDGTEMTFSIPAELEAGDYIELYGRQDSGGSLNVSRGNLSIQRIFTPSLITASFKDGMKSIGSNSGADTQEVYFGGAAGCSTACTTGACYVCKQKGGLITGVNFVSTGIYDILGIDGTKYRCKGTGYGTTHASIVHSETTSTTTTARVGVGNSAGLQNVGFASVTCIGGE